MSTCGGLRDNCEWADPAHSRPSSLVANVLLCRGAGPSPRWVDGSILRSPAAAPETVVAVSTAIPPAATAMSPTPVLKRCAAFPRHRPVPRVPRSRRSTVISRGVCPGHRASGTRPRTAWHSRIAHDARSRRRLRPRQKRSNFLELMTPPARSRVCSSWRPRRTWRGRLRPRPESRGQRLLRPLRPGRLERVLRGSAARGLRYRLAGENLARNNYPDSRTVEAAYEGLMASPGHRANILEARV